MKTIESKLSLTEFHPDDCYQHIAITDPDRCCTCRCKACLAICPADVFRWDNQLDHSIKVRYRQCLECGVCRLACGEHNIAFTYPPGGFGVAFHEG